ncbi:hypothetical protein ACOSQ4_006592 [Xanthoceras sorbifolium]
METKRKVKPRRSFKGKSMAKSFSWHLEFRIVRKNTKAVTEELKAISDAIVKMLNGSSFMRIGFPVVRLRPPGTVDEHA